MYPGLFQMIRPRGWIGPSWDNFCLLLIPVINFNKGSGNESMKDEVSRPFHGDILVNVRISLWDRSGLGKTRNSPSRDNVKTSSSDQEETPPDLYESLSHLIPALKHIKNVE